MSKPKWPKVKLSRKNGNRIVSKFFSAPCESTVNFLLSWASSLSKHRSTKPHEPNHTNQHEKLIAGISCHFVDRLVLVAGEAGCILCAVATKAPKTSDHGRHGEHRDGRRE